jgi:hypothetical protein
MNDLSEWGHYTGNTDFIYIDNEVLEYIENNDPAITSVHVVMSPGTDVDWGVAGKCIGCSKYIKRLAINGECNANDMKSFCRGLACNRNIVTFEIYPRGTNIGKIFKHLLPFFESNTNLRHFGTGSVVAFL